MVDADPYQAPKSDLAIVVDETFCNVKVFSAAGRLGRIRYLGYYFAISLLGGLAMVLLGVMTTVLPENLALTMTFLVIGATYIFMIVVGFILSIQRLHDFNASGWWCLLFLVPVVNMILGLVLLFTPGTAGANRFGNQTPPNSGGVIALASMVPIVFLVVVVGLIAVTFVIDLQNHVGPHVNMMSQQQ